MIEELQESIKTRYFKFKARYFEHFSEGRYLRKLKGKHIARRCFIIGNGPSLSASDLTVIHEHGEISFAFNRVFQILSQTSWTPTYYISQDYRMLRNCYKEVEKIQAVEKFIPSELSWYYGINVKGAHHFHLENPDDFHKPMFSENIARCVKNSNTVVFSAIQFAVYMGIKEIYLIGIDHHFSVMRNEGKIITDPGAKDYFSDDYNKDKEDLYIPNIDISTLTFIAAKDYADSHGIKIFNATRGGKLEVFPRMDFDSIFSE